MADEIKGMDPSMGEFQEFKEYRTRGGLENSNENQSMSDDCWRFARNGPIDGRLRSRSLRPRSGCGHRNSARRCPS
jgi:hypothetical protein